MRFKLDHNKYRGKSLLRILPLTGTKKIQSDALGKKGAKKFPSRSRLSMILSLPRAERPVGFTRLLSLPSAFWLVLRHLELNGSMTKMGSGKDLTYLQITFYDPP